MNERDATLLNDFYNGLLPDSEAQQLKERAGSDPDFGREFSLRGDMEDFLKRDSQRNAFEQQLQEIGKDYFQGAAAAAPAMTAKVNWGRRLAAAAAVVLVIAAYWFFRRPGLPEYRQYAQHSRDPLSLTVRGNTDVTEADAERTFNSGDYAGALQALETLLNTKPGDGYLLLYKGKCLIELDRSQEARNTLQSIAGGQTALRSEARWWMALSYLREKNYQACKAELLHFEDGEDFYPDAQQLLKELP